MVFLTTDDGPIPYRSVIRLPEGDWGLFLRLNGFVEVYTPAGGLYQLRSLTGTEVVGDLSVEAMQFLRNLSLSRLRPMLNKFVPDPSEPYGTLYMPRPLA